jgi:nondiscriminating aspartyl-tRNA synthetase
MERTLVKDVAKGEIVLKGWVHEIRDLAKLKFLLLRDASGIVQCITKDSALFDKFSEISLESVVEIKGKVKDAKVKAEGVRDDVEIEISSVEILNKAEDLPMHVNEKTTTTKLSNRLDNRFLDTRKPKVSAIFKIRSSIYRHIIDYFDSKDFFIINTPKITTIGLESGAESFKLDHFGKKTVLAQSPQFYKQMFVVGGFEKVLEIGAVYRAEKSHTNRHITEFLGVDFEMSFIKSDHDVMDEIEEMMKYVITNVLKDCERELKLLGIDLKVPKKIPRVPMSELKEMLKKKGKDLSPDDDLDAEAEKLIGEYALEKFNEILIFVTNYPTEVRPFYHMRQEGNPKETKSFDLLLNGTEICTGSQREHRLEVLQKQAKEKGLEIPKIYENIFRYGVMPHGGVGMGLDRITQKLLGLENIRESILLTRDPERVTP